MNRFFDLHKGEEDKRIVLENVRTSISFTGSNLWILMAAVFIASIGLNVNSTAVIIGAMLISPLMGPIVGAGFSLGIFDFHLLRKSLKNLLIATVASLLVSTIYFFLSPFKEAQSELLARTSPNIYDVLIAFFGGLVGVIAITRVEKGNPIPGVAIATALMPPLCTAGYGLATGNFSFFFGAMFLYIINCVFICIATYIIVLYLNYPASTFINKRQEKRIKSIISFTVVLIIIPSVFFAYRFIQEQRFQEKVKSYVHQEFEKKGNTIIYQKSSYSTKSTKKIELAFLMRKFTAKQIEEENKKLPQYGLLNTRLIIRQDSAFLADASNQKLADNEAEKGNSTLIRELNNKIDNYTLQSENIYPEAKALIPDLKSISVSKQQVYTKSDSVRVIPLVILKTDKPLNTENKTSVQKWLMAKLKVDTVDIIQEK